MPNPLISPPSCDAAAAKFCNGGRCGSRSADQRRTTCPPSDSGGTCAVMNRGPRDRCEGDLDAGVASLVDAGCGGFRKSESALEQWAAPPTLKQLLRNRLCRAQGASRMHPRRIVGRIIIDAVVIIIISVQTAESSSPPIVDSGSP